MAWRAGCFGAGTTHRTGARPRARSPVSPSTCGTLLPSGQVCPPPPQVVVSRSLRAYIAMLLQAAKRGDARAQGALGDIYAFGDGVPVDHDKAFRWYREGARRGHAESQFMLGLVERRGDLGEPLPGRAAHWLRKAAKQGHPDAPALLGELCFDRPEVAHDATETAHWLRVAANGGDGEALYLLGRLCEEEHGLRPGVLGALDYYGRAAQMRHGEAAYHLGIIYLDGLAGERDPARAREWFEVAAAETHEEALHELGHMILAGAGGARDVPRAARLFLVASHRGHLDAFAALAHVYSAGEVRFDDPVDALEWLHDTAPHGHPLVQELLGLACLWGIGTAKDPALAFQWFVRATRSRDRALRTRVGEALLMGSLSTEENEHAYALALLADSLGAEQARGWLDELSRAVTPPEAARAHALLGTPFSGMRH